MCLNNHRKQTLNECDAAKTLDLLMMTEQVVQLKNEATFNVTDFQVVTIFLKSLFQLAK